MSGRVGELMTCPFALTFGEVVLRARGRCLTLYGLRTSIAAWRCTATAKGEVARFVGLAGERLPRRTAALGMISRDENVW